MAQIMCMTSGLTGILNASFELVARLQSKGHDCICASPLPVGDKVQAQGLSYLQLDPVNYDPAPPLPEFAGPLRKMKRLVYKIRHVSRRRQEAVKALGMEAFLEKMRKAAPDLVIIDMELHQHIFALVTAGYKVLLLSQWFSTWYAKRLPPIVHHTIPGRGFSGSRLGLEWSWMNIRGQRWWMFTKKKVTSVYTDRRSILKKYARDIGFPLSYIRTNYWPGPFSYDTLPVISMTAEALEFPHQKRSNLEYVGPMVYTQRRDQNIEAADLQKIRAILNSKENRQLIYCSVSTFSKGDIKFLQRVIRAFEGQQDWLGIMSLGGLADAAALDPLPDNVYAFDRVPQLEILSRANLSINHGGIHTINECLHYKIPMLIYSGKRSDQNGCAARIHYHGLGIMADKDADTPNEIRTRIRQVLSNPAFRENIERIHREITTYREKNVLGRVVSSIVGSNESVNNTFEAVTLADEE